MAVISVPSSIQGQSYTVRIAGDTPTPEEQARINAYVAQMDARMAPQAPVEAAPEEPSMLGEIGSGLGRGFLGSLAAVPGGLGALAEAGYGKLTGQPVTPGSTAFGGVLQDISEGGRQSVEEMFGPSTESTAGRIGEAVGSIGSFLIPGGVVGGGARLLGAGARGAGALATAAGTGMGASLGADQQAQDIGDAILNGDVVDPDAQQSAILWGGLIGTSEMVAGGAAAKLIGTTYKLLNRVPPSMKEEAIATLGGRIRSALTTGGIEGAQEALSQVAQNLVSREYYDEGRILTEGAGESFGIGGAAGAIIDLALTSARAPAVRRGIQQRQQAEEEEVQRQIDEDQLEDRQDILDRIGFGETADQRAAQPPAPAPTPSDFAPRPSQTLALPAPEDVAAPQEAAPAAAAPAAEPRKQMPFRWRQYTSALNSVASTGDATIPSIQRAASPDGKAMASPSAAKEIRSQLVADGVLVRNKKAKGGFSMKPDAAPAFSPAESYRRTIEDLTADINDANTAREKAVQDARRAEQTGTKADARKFLLAAEQAQRTAADAERTRAEVEARLAQAPRDTITPSVERPVSPVAGGRMATPITEAPPAAQAAAVQGRTDRLRQALSYYEGRVADQNAEVKRLREAGKKVQLPQSEKRRIADLSDAVKRDAGVVRELKQRIARPAEDIAQANARAAAASAKAASDAAQQAARTPIYTAKEGELFSALRKRLDNLGLSDVKLVAERMIRPQGAPRDALIEGMMDVDARNGNRIIALSMGVYDPKLSQQELFDAISAVMNHEVIHAIRSLGLFTDAEWKILSDLASRQRYMKLSGGKVEERGYTYLQRAKQMYANDTPEVQFEEAVAEMFRDYVAGRLKIGGRPKTLMDRIKGFFQSIWQSHQDVGLTDANAIFEGVRFGRVGARERKPMAPEAARLSKQIVQRAAGDPDFQRWASGPNGESVITDESGQPKVFYTGTSKDQDFTKFNVGRHGGWFTADPAEASAYAEQNDSMGYKREGWTLTKTNTASRVIPAFLRAANPFTGPLPDFALAQNYKKSQSDWFDTLRGQGYDAWMPSNMPGLAVMLKDPSQVKSVFAKGADGKADMRRFSILTAATEQLAPQEASSAEQNIGRGPSGEVGDGQRAGLSAGQPAAPDIAPRTEDGRPVVGGVTLDELDNITPEFFDKTGWAILTSELSDSSEDRNTRAREQLLADFEYMNIPYREVQGLYKGEPDGISYIVLADETTAMMLGARYGQDSILNNRGFLYTSAPMPRMARTGRIAYGEQALAEDFYSIPEDGEAFSLGLDFSTGPANPDIGVGFYTIPERPQLPIRASDGLVELHHWSKKRLTNVDPAKAGTGPLNGTERRRGAQLGFFGINPRPDSRAQGTGYVKETGLGAREHVALVDPMKLYPFFTDPDGLFQGIERDAPGWETEYENRIKAAGYDGYYTERIEGTTPLGKVKPAQAPNGNVAAMFRKTKVQPVEEVQLGLRNPTRYSVRRAMTAPLTKGERRLTVLDRMDPNTALFIPDGKRRDVVEAITELNAPRRGYVIMPDDPDAVTRVARLMLAELRMALIRSPEAIGWYGTTLAKAKRVAAVLHPEISPINPYSGAKSNSYDPNAEHAWDLAMAITSNGMAVSENAKFANEQYEYWKENGRYMERGTGDQGSGMVAAFRAYNTMKESMTDDQIASFLSSQMTVKELRNNPVIKSLGINVGSNEGVNTVINGSYIFGPKIGQGFYQNLRGNFDPLTMDLWFMRMFNRITGRPFKEPEQSLLDKNAERVATLANAEGLTDYEQRVKRAAMAAEDIDIVTTENAGRFAVAFDKIYQRDFKKMYDDAVKASGLSPKSQAAKEIGKAARPEGTQLVLASKTYRGNLSTVPQDVPRGAGDRAFMRSVVDEVRAVLANEGNTISTADIQAVMWYAEKQLFAAMGVRQGKGGDNDYVDGAIELLRSKGIDDAEIARGLPAAERDRLRYRTASERTLARLRGESPADGTVEGGGGAADVSGEALGGGTPSPAGDGDQGGLRPRRLSVRYAVNPITPAVRKKVQSNQKALMYARSADAIAKILNLKGYGIEMEAAREFTDGLLRRFQDSMLPIGRMVQELSNAGLTITDAMDPYLQEELMHGVVGRRISENQTGFFEPLLRAVKKLNVPQARIDQLVKASDAASAQGKGFVGLSIKGSNSQSLALAEAFLYARHAKERNRYIKAQRDKTNESGSGMTDAEADVILNWFRNLDAANQSVLADIGKTAGLIIADTNQTRLDGGLISDEVVDAEEGATVAGTQYKYYVPLRGKVGEDADDDFSGPPSNPRFGARGREDRRALGRYDYPTDIIANLFTQNQNAILRAERNKVGQSFLNLLRADPRMTRSYARILEKAPTVRAVRSPGVLGQAPNRSAMDDANMLIVKENGKEVWVEFTDDRLTGVLNGQNGMSPTNGNIALRAMQGLNRYLSSINTSYNPEFIITNAFRDLQTAAVNVNQYELEGITSEVMGNLKNAGLGIKRHIRDDDRGSEWSKIYQDYMDAGGQNATNQFNSLAEEMDNIKTLLGDISEAGARGQWAKVKNSFVGKGVGSLLTFIEDYNTMVENTVRVSAYKALIDRGFTRQRAAQAARNLTVNFAKGGDYRPFMNAWSLFYNASLQGSFALLNAATRSSKVRKLWLGVMAVGIMQDQLNALLSDEDEDGEKVYDKIPDHILERNIVLPDFLGLSDRSYISIPMPYGLNMAHNIGRVTSRAMRGEYESGEAAYNIAMNIVDTLNPLGGTESLANFVAPTIADPFIDIIENEDFANKPIFKEGLPFDRTPAPDSQQFWATTSPSAVWIANNLNSLTGGNEVRPGFIDWSPDVLEFWFSFATGGVGRFIQSVPEGAMAVAEEGITDDSIRSIPLARKVVGTVSSREDMGGYIEGAKAVLTAAEELKRAREVGDAEWARQTMQRYAKELRLVGPIRSIDSALRRVSQQKNQITDNPNIPEAQKKLLLDALDVRRQMLLSRANGLIRDAGL